jgi:hypothetical protein
MPSRTSQRTRLLASAMSSWWLAGVMILSMSCGSACLFAQADTEKTEETESISPERIREKLEELADSQLGEEQKSLVNAAYDEALTQLEVAENTSRRRQSSRPIYPCCVTMRTSGSKNSSQAGAGPWVHCIVCDSRQFKAVAPATAGDGGPPGDRPGTPSISTHGPSHFDHVAPGIHWSGSFLLPRLAAGGRQRRVRVRSGRPRWCSQDICRI